MESTELVKAKITGELEAYFSDKHLFIVEVQVLANGRIYVFADGEQNITIDACAEISRHLEAFLEANHLVPENYTLEVSSPGMDQPLKVPAQFRKQKGKMVDVVLTNGKKITGTLLSSDEYGIVVQEELSKKKKNKPEEAAELAFPFSEIKTVKKYFNFKL